MEKAKALVKAVKKTKRKAGPGRPKGFMTQASKDKMEVKKAYQQRILKVADTLFNSQYALAVGEQYLMCKVTTGTGNTKRTHVEVITDSGVIIDYLNGDLETDNSKEYYYISTKPANGMVIDSMLDRVFGKPEQRIEGEFKAEVVHILKPEKLEIAQLESAAEQLRQRAEAAVEAELVNELDSPSGATDIRPINT